MRSFDEFNEPLHTPIDDLVLLYRAVLNDIATNDPKPKPPPKPVRPHWMQALPPDTTPGPWLRTMEEQA